MPPHYIRFLQSVSLTSQIINLLHSLFHCDSFEFVFFRQFAILTFFLVHFAFIAMIFEVVSAIIHP